jgi:glycosyltransferase involved in cell wall biosynthesis
LRIVHIDTGAEMRGGQHQVVLLIEALRTAGHESILLAKKDSPLWNAAGDKGIRCYAAGAREVWKRSGDAHIVHAHDAHGHSMAASGSRLPFVVSRRVGFPVKRNALSRLKYSKAARYIAVSQFVAEQLKAAQIPEEKIDVVYDGVPDLGLAEPWSPEFPAITLASADPEKGRDLVERAAAHSGIEVVFSSDLPKDLKRACMFVYISRNEGLGSAALLAMKMGVPVIASAVGGLKEVFVDGVSGLHVNNDVTEIIRAMRRVLANAAATRQIVVKAQERVEEMFTVEHMLRGTLGSYARVFGS